MFLVLAVLSGCAGEPVRTPATYVVRPDDTLYSIAWRNHLDYRQLAAWNGIGRDYRIVVGERLRLHPPAYRQGTPRPAPPRIRRWAGKSTAPRLGTRVVPAAPAAARSAVAAALRWRWPTRHAGPVHRLVNGALLIHGMEGQIVRAAAAGRVVYTGRGIPGFGLLVIIKHSTHVLSAYAYNAAVTVSDGQRVAAGTPIARMGVNAKGTPMLYFEIRADGRTIDPLPYLP
ncbi:MAG: peptidoglycan DD-metalloendopeptidase family protein [Steroidobacteraceae bacterium]|nr:peptidoglycan DD-metalloendopeptidase family protein [Steroidobacteraceae bacterium]